MTSTALNVLLYGSCVSRDTAEFRGSEWNRVDYVARQSLISAASPKMQIPQGSELKSAFQLKAAGDDLQSSLFDVLRIRSSSADRVVIDLIDERLGVYGYPGGSYLTFSNELNASGWMKRLSGRTPFVEFGTDQHFELWKQAANRLNRELESLGLKEKTYVLEAPFVETTDEGNPVPLARSKSSSEWNRLYRRYYDFLSNLGMTVVAVPEPFRFSTATHKWGPAQYHYVDGAYLALANQIENKRPKSTG